MECNASLMHELEQLINDAWERRADLAKDEIEATLKPAIERVLDALEAGTHARRRARRRGRLARASMAQESRAAVFPRQREPRRRRRRDARIRQGAAALRSRRPKPISRSTGARVVPGALVRRGAHIAKDAVLMPSYVNIGAYVGAGTMVDTWATVGSCAQIGANVHLSGGVGIGGVLEPLQANPTIIEDGCFIGARSEVVEGVIVERGSVIGMGVFLGQSTRIYDRATGEVSYGRVPAGSVVVAGSLPAADGSHSSTLP